MYKEKTEGALTRPKVQLIYSVEGIDNLLIILGRIGKTMKEIKSSVYYDEKGEKYYLILEDVSKKERFLAFIGEYARNVKPSYISFINEYCKCISKSNATRDFESVL